ncbi:uncharacterized protein LOC113360153 [Papaver somniferum]|uniref:uncharacterized protein LOC113360153 n=1 Tax=Papaver somniferum TaxID=3469 RepID=UPI000E6F90CE|nr:uncharacterized protein LOC113360153 [Papaver somniferum]
MAYARVCVEIAVDSDFPDHIDAMVGKVPIQIPVKYSWKPPRCYHCGVFGHHQEKCGSTIAAAAVSAAQVAATAAAAKLRGPNGGKHDRPNSEGGSGSKGGPTAVLQNKFQQLFGTYTDEDMGGSRTYSRETEGKKDGAVNMEMIEFSSDLPVGEGNLPLSGSESGGSGKLLKEVNSTFITLVAKCDNASSVLDFRPIACCNVIYKCISKIIASRMKFILKGLVSSNQSVFISGRSIQDNILLAHEIVRNYHKSIGSPRCALKIDLHKAYDSVSWEAIVAVMKKFGFPNQFIDWIYVCISTAKFSVMINGSPYEFFGAARGLRQGCPLSPYLFVMVMEFFSGLLQKQVSSGNYGLHPKCRATKLTHLCFADDVLVVFKGNVQSAQVLSKVVIDFSNFSGLIVNCDKISLFFSAVDLRELDIILICLKCVAGELPVKYLGVPLISTRLSYSDFQTLLCSVTKRVKSWKAKHLAFAGRMQLIKVVLSGMITVCTVERAGGLGIRDLEQTNIAANLRHIWDITSGRDSIWTQWVHLNLIKQRDFWDLVTPQDCSWIWKRILELRDVAKQFMGTCLGNGAATNFLFGFWHLKGRLWDWLADECMCSICPNRERKVADFMHDGKFVLPNDSHGAQCECVYLLQEIEYDVRDEDKIIWKGSKTGDFSMKDTFKVLSGAVDEIGWTRLFWYKNNIPRHSFISWLACHRRLKTKAKLMRWGIVESASCVFCENGTEDEENLFLNFTYSMEFGKGC